MVIQNARARQKRDSEDEMLDIDQDPPEVDLYQLQVNTLRRYKKHYRIPTRPGLNKAQLADVSFVKVWSSFCRHDELK